MKAPPGADASEALKRHDCHDGHEAILTLSLSLLWPRLLVVIITARAGFVSSVRI